MKVVTAAEMRIIETAAERGGMSLPSLMQRAGEAVARVTADLADGGDVLILIGPGKNGGDGLVCARALSTTAIRVTLYIYDRQLDELDGSTGAAVVHAADDRSRRVLRGLAGNSTVVVDALLGIGQSRPPDTSLTSILETINTQRGPSTRGVAVDVPTGVGADTGVVWNQAFRADVTVCMGFLKRGLLLHPGSDYCGQIRLIDLGFPPTAATSIALSVPAASDIAGMIPVRQPDSNKGSGGRVLVIAGSRDYAGAPVLASMAAYRIGAGLVQVAVTSSVQAAVAAHALEPIYLSLPEQDGRVSPDSLSLIARALPSARAVVLGPGLGLSSETISFVSSLVLDTKELERKPVVVDADGLNALSQIPEWWRSKASIVVTPHPGEMSRLTELKVEAIQADRVNIALRYAAEWGHVVVLKGAGTVVAAPDGTASINPTGGPNLATAGTGDVLSGVIGGLLAQGCSPFGAAVCGAYLHGMAGDILREEYGDAGTIASDLHGVLPVARLSTLREGGIAT